MIDKPPLLLQHFGSHKALIINESILQAAGLDGDALFQIIIDPNGGIVIQSIQTINDQLHKENVNKVVKKHSKLFKRLTDK